MPRISSSETVMDFCQGCMPPQWLAVQRFGENTQYNTDHPDYEKHDFQCDLCNRLLMEEDN